MNDVKFKVGDSVVIVDAQPEKINSYKYKDGEIGTISEDFDEIMGTWCYVDFTDECGVVHSEAVYFWEMKKVDEVSTKTTPTFKIGDKVVFCKSSLESGMIDAKEDDVFTVQVQDNSIVYLKEQSGGYHHTHFEHYVEKEKEVEKKLAKVGDKIRIVAAESTGDCYKNGDVLEVVATHASWVGVDVFIDDALGNFHVYHTEYEIVEDNQEDDFVFTEEHIGMEVFCLLRGKGVISEVRKYYDDDHYPVEVEFGYTADRYTSKGKIYDDHKTRVLFFSEPKIEAERFPPKKKFTPTLKEGDNVLLWTSEGCLPLFVTVLKEEETKLYYMHTNGQKDYASKDSIKIKSIGEEIKFK